MSVIVVWPQPKLTEDLITLDQAGIKVPDYACGRCVEGAAQAAREISDLCKGQLPPKVMEIYQNELNFCAADWRRRK